MSLSAYYFSFDSSGNKEVDKVLEAIASAGSSYHNTEDWNDAGSGSAPVEWIQDAANDLADYVNRLERKSTK